MVQDGGENFSCGGAAAALRAGALFARLRRQTRACRAMPRPSAARNVATARAALGSASPAPRPRARGPTRRIVQVVDPGDARGAPRWIARDRLGLEQVVERLRL